MYMFDTGFPPPLSEQIGRAFRNSRTAKFLLCYAEEKYVTEIFSVKCMGCVSVTMHGSNEKKICRVYERTSHGASYLKKGVVLQTIPLSESQTVDVDPLLAKACVLSRSPLHLMQKSLAWLHHAWKNNISAEGTAYIAEEPTKTGMVKYGSINGTTSVAARYCGDENVRATYQTLAASVTQHARSPSDAYSLLAQPTHEALDRGITVLAEASKEAMIMTDRFEKNFIEYIMILINNVDWTELGLTPRKK